MTLPSDSAASLEEARRLQAAGRLVEAEQAYRRLAESVGHRESALRALVDLYLQARRPAEAVGALAALTEIEPDRLRYYARLCTLLDGLGRTDEAIAHYRRLLSRQPGLAAAHFNVALLYKKQKHYADALAAYREALRLGIDAPQEVWSNIGVLYSEMHRGDAARQAYEEALRIDPGYIPALFNLAGLLEEAGDREAAVDLYRNILRIEPGHADSLARLAHAQSVESVDDPLIDTLREAIDAARDDPPARESLLFALGKTLDDTARYDEAFAAYHAANELGRLRNPTYDPAAAEQVFEQLIRIFDRDWIDRVQTDSSASPIFICGMFRSGSTLTEQILAAHPSVTAGGELDLLPWLVANRLAPFPYRLQSASSEELTELGEEYIARVRELFPRADNVTDKRPDNFLYLGVIRAIFPRARIVYTRRHLPDNCLSIYFQQLGGNLAYATDLEHIAHYYRLQQRLMTHWKACFAENIWTVDYDELVRSPEPVLRGLLEFLGLDWDRRCLEFRNTTSLVKTASVWQVREALHSRSSGRWRHYERFLGSLRPS